MAQVICQICHQEFTAMRSDAKYCNNDECKRQAKRNNAKNPEVLERKRAYGRAYMEAKRAENPEKCKEAYKQWYDKKGVEYHKQWRDEHPEYVQNSLRKLRKREKENPELKKQWDAVYYQRHAEQVKATNAAWQKANPEKYRAIQHVSLIHYRARLAKAEGNWTHQEFQELCKSTDYHCWYCHKKFDKLTVDHMTPIARGGSNDITNIAPACLSCNTSKRDTTPLEFISYLVNSRTRVIS